jgi:hypothetical protein
MTREIKLELIEVIKRTIKSNKKLKRDGVINSIIQPTTPANQPQ